MSRFGIGALLFLSGTAALIYQLLWIKQLSLVVGVDVYAVTTAVSAFFGGLAVGSAIFGRTAESARRPLYLYALIEVGVAVLGVAATVALAHSAQTFAIFEAHVGVVAWLLPVALVGIPASCMGGTLPVLVRAVAPGAGAVGRMGGRLYAANTAGAIAGALLVPFALVPAFGVRGSAFVAAGLNLGAAAAAWAFERRRSQARRVEESQGPTVDRPKGPNTSRSKGSRARGPEGSTNDGSQGRKVARSKRLNGEESKGVANALWMYAVAGGIALGYEVVWSQAIMPFVSTRAFAFSIVLATYLAGLALGSVLYARVADRVRDPWGIFGLLIASAGLIALLLIAALGPWFLSWQSNLEEVVRTATSSEMAAMCARFALAAVGMLLAPTLLLGAAFPAALRLGTTTTQVGQDVGRLLALNTAGGIAGTLATGFLLLPALGIVRTLGALAFGASLLGLVAAFQGTSVGRASRVAVVAIAAITVLTALITPQDRIARLLTAERGGTLLSYAESPGGTVAVVEQMAGTETFRRLYIQSVSNSGDVLPSRRYMRLQALLPVLVHRGNPRDALVIGLGTGITAGALLPYPTLERRVVAELLPAVVQVAPLFRGNFDVTRDQRIDIRVRDGRRELLRGAEQYDVITLEPPPPSAAGVVNLYSRDFYELARTRLRPQGLLAQWWPLATQNDEDSRSMVRAFLDAFPYASLWTTELHEMLLLGSPDPMELNTSRIAARFAARDVASALGEVGIASPAALLATWVTNREGLEHYAAGAPPVTDDRPTIEYATWTRRGEFSRVMPMLLALSDRPPLAGTSDAFAQSVTVEQNRLHRLYEAALDAYAGRRELAGRGLAQVIAEDPSNPYYASFAAGH